RDLKQVLIDAGITGLQNWSLGSPFALSTDGTVIVGTGVRTDVAPENQYPLIWRAVLPRPAPPCVANFNNVGGVTVADIFAFLNAWFAGLPSANVNGVGGVTVADIFFFLNHWFAGC